MATVDNEKYLRIILLLAKGGTLVVREVFARELASYIAHHGGNLDTCLQNYESNVKKRNYLSRPQCLKLFPPTGKTNFQQWDIGLLVFATLHVFGTSLSPQEKFEIRQIQLLRNNLAHSPNAELDSSSYQDYLLILQNATRTLAAGFRSTNIKTKTEQLLNDCENGSLDIKSTLEHLQKTKEKDELFEEVLEKFEKLEDVSNRNTDTIISRVNEVGEGIRQTPEQVSFSAYLDHVVRHLGKDQPIVHNVILLNDAGAYSNVSGIFHVPVSGVYLFSWSVSARALTGEHTYDILVKLVVNGVHAVTFNIYAWGKKTLITGFNGLDTVDAVAESPATHDDNQGSNTVILQLKQGEEVWTASQNSGGDIFGANAERTTSFTGVLLYMN